MQSQEKAIQASLAQDIIDAGDAGSVSSLENKGAITSKIKHAIKHKTRWAGQSPT